MKIMASSPITSRQIDGAKVETVTIFIFLGSKITVDGDCCYEIQRFLLLGKKGITNLDNAWKSKDHFADKGSYGQSYGFSSSHVQMWEMNHKGGWALKNWCFWTVVLENSLEPFGQEGDQTSQS